MSVTAADLAQIPMSADLGQTLTRGSEFAAATGASEVTLEHLLAALCDDADAIAVLDASDVDVGRLKADLATQMHQSAGGPGPARGGFGIAPDVRRILEAAAAAARGSRRRDINGAIVLAAIVGDGRSMAAEILQAHGLTFDNAIRALQTALAPASAPPREPPVQAPPVADDVLARARERVQSRSAPSLRDIMKENPRPPAPPPVASPVVVAAPVPAPSFTLPEPDVAREAAAPSAPAAAPASAPTSVLSGGGSAGAPPPERHSEHALPDAAPGNAPDDDFPNLDGVLAEESATVQPGPSLPFPGRPAAAAPGSAASVSVEPGFGPTLAPAPAQISTPAQSGRPGFAPSPAPAGSSSGPLFRLDRDDRPPGIGAAIPSSPFPSVPPSPSISPGPSVSPGFPGGFGEFARPRPGAVLPPPIPQSGPPSAPVQTAPPPGMRAQPGAPQSPGPMQPGRPGPADLQRRPGPPVAGAPAQPKTAQMRGVAPRRGNVRVEAGQLAENIPRSMRVGRTERAEVRIAKASIKALAEGLDGGGPAWQHAVTVTKAMAVRLRAPEGGFFIESASPETQWIENNLGFASDDFASWRFLITPQERGRARLQIIVSARTVGADGLAAETALPDQIVEVKVRRNIKRGLARLMGWTVAAVVGGALSTFGEVGINLAKTYAQKFLH